MSQRADFRRDVIPFAPARPLPAKFAPAKFAPARSLPANAPPANAPPAMPRPMTFAPNRPLPAAFVPASSAPPPAPPTSSAPPSAPPAATDPLDRAGVAVVTLLRQAAERTADECDRAMLLAHGLSRELAAAEQRAAALQAEIVQLRQRATNAESWLARIHQEIGEKLLDRGASPFARPSTA